MKNLNPSTSSNVKRKALLAMVGMSLIGIGTMVQAGNTGQQDIPEDHPGICTTCQKEASLSHAEQDGQPIHFAQQHNITDGSVAGEGRKINSNQSWPPPKRTRLSPTRGTSTGVRG